MAEEPGPAEVHVGGRLRRRRLSLTEFAAAADLSKQQIIKYERAGSNPPYCSEMLALCTVIASC
jgi:transcriptional regulator with XRE-family HTH domain